MRCLPTELSARVQGMGRGRASPCPVGCNRLVGAGSGSKVGAEGGRPRENHLGVRPACPHPASCLGADKGAPRSDWHGGHRGVTLGRSGTTAPSPPSGPGSTGYETGPTSPGAARRPHSPLPGHTGPAPRPRPDVPKHQDSQAGASTHRDAPHPTGGAPHSPAHPCSTPRMGQCLLLPLCPEKGLPGSRQQVTTAAQGFTPRTQK